MTEPGLIESSPAGPDTLRLFFALWPDDATRAALNRAGKWLHQHWGGRRMRADTLHITLAFLGSTPAGQLDALAACADMVRTDAFELVLDQAGYWRHNRIGWLGVNQTPQHLELVGALNTALQGGGFAVDARPHVPHVTLLRNSAGGEALPCEPVHWPVRDFVLVVSRREADGMHYDVIRRWPLA
ncbi:MAG TPA: RNA 2',3'-cyclic phosphodiesterase [Thiobacillus sp.]|nr:RNA 2',3'-cyclic phosphodiesterase [Thiobacillus sp.]